jgi:hypothetical protein
VHNIAQSTVQRISDTTVQIQGANAQHMTTRKSTTEKYSLLQHFPSVTEASIHVIQERRTMREKAGGKS